MKTIFRLAAILMALAISVPVTAQKDKKLTREEKKKLKLEKHLEQKAKLVQLAKDSTWVIEAFSVSAPGSDQISVSPGTNFVSVIKKDGNVQLTFSNVQTLGANGLGGVTLEGTVENYEMDAGEDLAPIQLTVRVKNKRSGWVLLSISVQADGRATVNVSGSYGGQFNFSGHMMSPADSGAYKGFAP